MSTIIRNYCSRFLMLGLVALGLSWSLPSYAIYSCDAATGFIAGAGSGDSCGLNHYEVQATYSAGDAVILDGAAHTSLPSGAMGGHISLLNNGQGSGGDAQFYSNMLVDFSITGPTSTTAVMVDLIFSFHGSIAATCASCDADMNFANQLQGAGLNIQAGSTRLMYNGVISDWANYAITNGLSSSGSVSSFDSDTNIGSITFDASTILGQNLRFTGSLGGNVHLLGSNPLESIAIQADNTSLFNIVLPEGYSLNVGNTGFLSNPTLVSLPEVPLPTALSCFISGLMIFPGAAFARWRRFSSQ